MKHADKCKSDGYVYGGNTIVDQLLACSINKAFDLDLNPEGDRIKMTSKTLVEQGFSNKTIILHAKLNGIWTQRRASSVESSWICGLNKTFTSSVIQVDGLSLEVFEKVEIPMSRNLSKLAHYRPCKTFDLPSWLCRQSKPLFKTTRTWVNSAYFNLTLSQEVNKKRPTIEKLSLIFTCPETFKQKIVHSPTAMYLLTKYMNGLDSTNTVSNNTPEPSKNKQREKRGLETENVLNTSGADDFGESRMSNFITSATSQNGKGIAAPPYHSSVNLIVNRATEMLRASLDDCIKIIDSDLTLIADHNSFSQYRYKNIKDVQANQQDDGNGNESKDGIDMECSSKLWLQNRIDLSNAAENLFSESQNSKERHWKRSQGMQTYPIDPNQLLDPYEYYHENAMNQIDDTA